MIQHLCWLIFIVSLLSTKDFSLKYIVKCFYSKHQKTWKGNFMYHTDHSAFYMIKVYFLKTELQLQAIKQKQSFSDQ